MTYEQALNKAAALCSGAEYCERQILEKLRRWEIGEDDAERILKYLKEEKYIDSERFCHAFASDKLRYNHWGRFKIRMALRQLRLPDEDIDQALADIDDEEYTDILNKVLDTKARTLRDTDPYQRRAKLVRHAASHGFETDLILDRLEDDGED